MVDRALFDQPGLVEFSIKMLGQLVVLSRRRAPEVVERKRKSPIDVGLDGVLLVAEVTDILPGGERA